MGLRISFLILLWTTSGYQTDSGLLSHGRCLKRNSDIEISIGHNTKRLRLQPSERYSAVPSFWTATANPHPDLARLTSDMDTDVAIVGGGFTGLS